MLTCCVLELGNIEKILKEKTKEIKIKGSRFGILNDFEKVAFMYRYYHVKKYRKEIDYLIKHSKECAYMDQVSKEFSQDANTYLACLKHDLEENSKEYMVEEVYEIIDEKDKVIVQKDEKNAKEKESIESLPQMIDYY